MAMAKEVIAPINLYGEIHDKESIQKKELEIWGMYYNDYGMRHLFIEAPYYSAEFLNLWMLSSDDKIYDELQADARSTYSGTDGTKLFFKYIKENYPETIFHGTDVGHQYDTTGQRYLKYLEENGLENSNEYRETLKSIEQGKTYYESSDNLYRENKMTENFIYEYEKLDGEKIMGIYGSYHIAGSDDNIMALQLLEYYGDKLVTKDLRELAKDIGLLKKEVIVINGKEYEALYYGKQTTNWIEKYEYREFWLLKNIDDDFKNFAKTMEYLPANEYPVVVEVNEVYVIDYTTINGEVKRGYYRCDGKSIDGELITHKITLNTSKNELVIKIIASLSICISFIYFFKKKLKDK